MCLSLIWLHFVGNPKFRWVVGEPKTVFGVTYGQSRQYLDP
jgi:hypothetical protein